MALVVGAKKAGVANLSCLDWPRRDAPAERVGEAALRISETHAAAFEKLAK